MWNSITSTSYTVIYLYMVSLSFLAIHICYPSLVQKACSLQRIRTCRLRITSQPSGVLEGRAVPFPFVSSHGLTEVLCMLKKTFLQAGFLFDYGRKKTLVYVLAFFFFFSEFPKVKPKGWGSWGQGSWAQLSPELSLLCACIVLCTRRLDQAPCSW